MRKIIISIALYFIIAPVNIHAMCQATLLCGPEVDSATLNTVKEKLKVVRLGSIIVRQYTIGKYLTFGGYFINGESIFVAEHQSDTLTQDQSRYKALFIGKNGAQRPIHPAIASIEFTYLKNYFAHQQATLPTQWLKLYKQEVTHCLKTIALLRKQKPMLQKTGTNVSSEIQSLVEIATLVKQRIKTNTCGPQHRELQIMIHEL